MIRRELNLYLTRDAMLKDRDILITKHKNDKDFKYSDTFVQTSDIYIEFKVVPVNFPLADFGGFDKVNCQDAIDKFMYIIDHLEKLQNSKKEQPNTPENSDKDEEEAE